MAYRSSLITYSSIVRRERNEREMFSSIVPNHKNVESISSKIECVLCVGCSQYLSNTNIIVLEFPWVFVSENGCTKGILLLVLCCTQFVITFTLQICRISISKRTVLRLFTHRYPTPCMSESCHVGTQDTFICSHPDGLFR